ncbi:MAG: L-2-amino-thiazoline-4-carboxylic acid hydrolase [Bacillus sp. (in: firmicutes)]
MLIKLMSALLLRINKKAFAQTYDKLFYNKFRKNVKRHLKEIIPEVPNIGDSIFKFSYLMGVFYIAWYKSFLELGLTSNQANQWIWTATENALKKIPNCLVPLAKKIYLGGMLKKAERHTQKSKHGQLPEYDWNIEYVKIDDNSFRLDTYECGIKKLCEKFGTEEMLPSMCRMDYLTAHYLRHDFKRDKTLGDGDNVCNNRFSFTGECEWAPEKGFEDRK